MLWMVAGVSLGLRGLPGMQKWICLFVCFRKEELETLNCVLPRGV